MHNLKTSGYIWTFDISNDCYIIGDILCVVYSCMRDLIGELCPPTHIGHSLIQHCVCVYPASPCIHVPTSLLGVQLCNRTKLTYSTCTLSLHTTPQTKALLPTMDCFIRTRLASYTTHCSVF